MWFKRNRKVTALVPRSQLAFWFYRPPTFQTLLMNGIANLVTMANFYSNTLIGSLTILELFYKLKCEVVSMVALKLHFTSGNVKNGSIFPSFRTSYHFWVQGQ